MIYIPARKILLLLTALFISVNVVAQDRPVTDDNNADPPKVGLRVLEVLAGSPAAAAGLQPMDIISSYGGDNIVDAATYFVARDAHQSSATAKVEMVYWRGKERLNSIVSPGRMGIKFEEYNPANYQLQSLMQRLDLLNAIPGFSEGQVMLNALPPRDSLLQEIDAAIQKGAGDGTLTPTQVLVARISAILDDSPPAEIEKQTMLLRQLLSTQNYGLIDYLSYEVFFTRRRYHAAVPTFKKVLDYRPNDANVRLNLGIAYWRVEKYAEAEATADYAMQHTSGGLSKHGYVVAYQVKANAALGTREFAKALDNAEQAAKLEGPSSYLMVFSLFAAAEAGDAGKFNDVMKDFEKSFPPDYARLRPRLDALEALVLTKTGQLDQARLLAGKSIRMADPEANAKYWLQYPNGQDVVTAWKQLLRN